jgi:hypothetical protein
LNIFLEKEHGTAQLGVSSFTLFRIFVCFP